MRQRALYFLLTLFSIFFVTDVYCCTSAIITGKLTPDGRPLLWKHRDTGELNNRIEYFKGEKYNFLALVNSPDNLDEAWSGTNSAGFSIMNTASYNLKDDDVPSSEMDKEGVIMFKALSLCKSLEDFENLLDEYPRPIGVEANFGVIDAYGGAAYYEVNNDSWTKIDVNDPKIAPQGYLVYTNHSYTGRLNDGMGYIRYTTADNIMKKAVAQNCEITPQWIFENLSRSFYNSVLDLDLKKEAGFLQDKGSGFFIDQDFIPRKSTSASIVVAGVKPGEDPLNTVMWTVLGYPPVSLAVPAFIRAGEFQPWYLTENGKSDNGDFYSLIGVERSECNAFMCDLALKTKSRIFPIKRGNGDKYFNFGMLYNTAGNGIMQNLKNSEKDIFEISDRFIADNRDKKYNKERYEKLYGEIFDMIRKAYGF